jgi:hypothetical protein
MEFCIQEKQEGRLTCLDGGSRGWAFIRIEARAN